MGNEKESERIPLEDIAQEIIRAKNDLGFSRLDGGFQPLIDEVCEEFDIEPYENTGDPKKDIRSYMDLRDYVRENAKKDYWLDEVASFAKSFYPNSQAVVSKQPQT